MEESCLGQSPQMAVTKKEIPRDSAISKRNDQWLSDHTGSDPTVNNLCAFSYSTPQSKMC